MGCSRHGWHALFLALGCDAYALSGWVWQASVVDKLRREVARLNAELDRLDKEVTRQKALRYLWLLYLNFAACSGKSSYGNLSCK